MQTLPWIAFAVAFAALGIGLAAWLLKQRDRKKGVPLPKDWAVVPRPVFSTDERRAYRLLREALPHHVVLSKLPLVRFCQPTDPAAVRYWYDLLGAKHVTFAVCSANGRVLAAIDLDTERGDSRRTLLIKQSVLNACRVRYLRCPVDNMPSIAELQLLVPQISAANRGPQSAPAPAPASDLHQARDSLSHTVASRRAERTALWQDSSVFQDSFFAPDSRMDGASNSEFAALQLHQAMPMRIRATDAPRRPSRGDSQAQDDDMDSIGGIVTDDEPRIAANSRH
jgi:Protein of unknown function (DUF2726)